MIFVWSPIRKTIPEFTSSVRATYTIWFTGTRTAGSCGWWG